MSRSLCRLMYVKGGDCGLPPTKPSRGGGIVAHGAPHPGRISDVNVPMPQHDQEGDSQDPYFDDDEPAIIQLESSRLNCLISSSSASKTSPQSGVACRSLLLESEIVWIG
eukprot:996005-Amphidinium_carterae.2